MLDAATGLGGDPDRVPRGSRSPTRGRATRASRTTRSPRSRVASPSRVHDPAADASAATTRTRIRADLATAGIDTRHELVDVDPGRRRSPCSRRAVCTSSRWADPRPPIRCCSRRPPPPASLAARARCVRGPPPRLGLVGLDARRARSRVERVLNLLALLLDTRRALTRDEIVHDVAGYPPQIPRTGARFERDKETLRGMGVPLTTSRSATAPSSATASDPSDYYLPDLGLDAEEPAALHVAVSAVVARQPRGRGRAVKLGGLADDSGRADRVAAARARARDAVRGVPRPGPSSRSTHRDRVAHGRAVGPLVEARPLVRRRLRPRPRRDARVPRRSHRRRRRARRARRVRRARRFRPDDHVESRAVAVRRRPAGHRRGSASTPTTRRDARRARSRRDRRRRAPSRTASAIVELAGDEPRRVPQLRARLPRPRRGARAARIRADIVAWLERGRGRHRRAIGMSPRALAGPEIQRILALVPWIVAHPGSTEDRDRGSASASPSTSSTKTSRSCLMIGVPPYSPGDYIDVEEDDDGRRLDPPRRLLPPAAAAHPRRRSGAARRGPGAARGSRAPIPRGPLATALDEARGGARASRSRRRRGRTRAPRADPRRGRRARAHRDRVLVGRTRRAHDPPHRSRSRVLRDRRVVRRRVLPPRARRAHVPRRPHPVGRADRRDASNRARPASRPATSTRRAPTTGGSRSSSRPAAAGSPRPTRPKRSPSAADGSLEIVLAVSEQAWLERLLLRLGPDARVVAPAAVEELAPTPLGEFSAVTARLERQESAGASPPGVQMTPSRRPDTRARGRA